MQLLNVKIFLPKKAGRLVGHGTQILLVVGCLMASSCEEFFDINEDPNNPTEASVNLLLTNTQ